MKNKFMNTIFIVALAVGIGTTVDASAKTTPGHFAQYVTKNGQNTKFNKKESNSKNYAVNVYNMGGSHNFWFHMVNSGNERRSETGKALDDVDTRYFTQWGTKNYKYKLKIGRQNKVGDYSSLYIKGAWNPY